MNFDVIAVGRTPLGSAIRAVLITMVIDTFWGLFLNNFWQRIIVTFVTALIVVAAAHWVSRRDDTPRA